MNQQARTALRRRCIINQLMMRPESFRERLNRVTNLFPVHVKTWR